MSRSYIGVSWWAAASTLGLMYKSRYTMASEAVLLEGWEGTPFTVISSPPVSLAPPVTFYLPSKVTHAAVISPTRHPGWRASHVTPFYQSVSALCLWLVHEYTRYLCEWVFMFAATLSLDVKFENDGVQNFVFCVGSWGENKMSYNILNRASTAVVWSHTLWMVRLV